MIVIRKALACNLDFIFSIDFKSEGTTTTNADKTPEEIMEHRHTVSSFIENDDNGIGAFICEDQSYKKKIGLLMYRVRNRDDVPDFSILRRIDRALFPEDGQLMEVYQLWVDKDYRKRGIAYELKLKLEEEARIKGVQLVYSHTEESNIPVIKMNSKLDYEVVWRGPIWDDQIVRIAFIKHLVSS